MWVLFKYIYTMSGLFGFLLILSSCNASHNSDSTSSVWSLDDATANAVFKVERRIKSDLSSFYSIEDRIMFVSRQNRNQAYDQIQSVHVDGECYGELGRSFKINKVMLSNVFSFYTFLSLEQLQTHSNRRISSLKKDIDQAYQCHFSFIGATADGSTKSIQNIRVEIPKRPRGGITIHHRDDRNRVRPSEKLEFTELDLKNYHVTVLSSSPSAKMTLKCSDFQESVLFDFRNNSKRSLASIFNLQKHYSLLLANPLQHCHITYGKFGDPYWAWSKSFKLLFQEAFEATFDLTFNLKRIISPSTSQVDQREKAFWIQLGILEVSNPFSEPMIIFMIKDHNSYLNAHIYYLEDKNNLSYKADDELIKKERHDIFLQFAQTGNHQRSQNSDRLDIFGGQNYAFYVDSKSSITKRIVIKTLDESYYSNDKVLGVEVVKSENPNHDSFFKLYFHNSRGISILPIFDEFKDEVLVSICAFRLCHRAFDAMLYNNRIRTGQIL